MVQEANVKRAQAEKALAESEMKVRSNLPCGEVWWGVVSGSGCYASSVGWYYDDSQSVGIIFSQMLNISCFRQTERIQLLFSLCGANPNMTWSVLCEGCCQLFVAQFHSFCFSWNILLHKTEFPNQIDKDTTWLVWCIWLGNAIWHLLQTPDTNQPTVP